MPGFQNLIGGIQGAREAVQGLTEDLKNANSIAQTASTSMKTASTQMTDSARAARENVEQELTRAQKFGEDHRQRSIDTLNSLEERLKEFGTNWNTELELAFAALKAGKITGQEFIDTFGDWVIQVEEGSTTIKRELEGIDPKVFEDRIRSITDSLRDGSAGIEQAIARVRELGGFFAEELAKMFAKLKEGTATIGEVIASLQRLGRDLEGQPLGDLVGVLERGLREEGF